MTAIRVIATLLLDPARGVIKGKQFAHDRVIGEPIQWARVMAQIREVDELVIFDVTHGPPNLELIKRIAAECYVPVAYGGGIHDVDTAINILRNGADKVVLQPRDHVIWKEVSDRVGAQSLVVCLNDSDDRYVVGMWPFFGEVLIQSTSRDGMMVGYDIDAILRARQRFDVPLVASSGCGSAQDCVDAVKAGADGVAVGAAFQFTDLTPNDVKKALHAAGYPVRLMEEIA